VQDYIAPCVLRFEKNWLNDAAAMFSDLMDDDVRYMIPSSSKETMEDVLARFDPRPETGMYINNMVKYSFQYGYQNNCEK